MGKAQMNGVLCVTNFVCHANWWQIFFFHYRLMFYFHFSLSTIVSRVESDEWRSLIAYEWKQPTYVFTNVYISEHWERLSLRFSFFAFLLFFYFYCFICGVISFSCWTDGLKHFYFYFRFRSSYFIDARPGHIFIVYVVFQPIGSCKLRVTNETCAFFYLLHYSLPLPWTMDVMHVFRFYNFSLFWSEKRVRVRVLLLCLFNDFNKILSLCFRL